MILIFKTPKKRKRFLHKVEMEKDTPLATLKRELPIKPKIAASFLLAMRDMS